MSALQCELIAINWALTWIEEGNIARAFVWLRLADEAHEAWNTPGYAA